MAVRIFPGQLHSPFTEHLRLQVEPWDIELSKRIALSKGS
jgi:hypothetical protein